MDLYETSTPGVYRSAIKHYEEILETPPPTKFAAKTTYFRRLHNLMATLRANISGEKHDIDNRKTALEITKGPVRR